MEARAIRVCTAASGNVLSWDKKPRRNFKTLLYPDHPPLGGITMISPLTSFGLACDFVEVFYGGAGFGNAQTVSLCLRRVWHGESIENKRKRVR